MSAMAAGDGWTSISASRRRIAAGFAAAIS